MRLLVLLFLLILVLAMCTGCQGYAPQRGGKSIHSLSGGVGAELQQNENPKTPSTQHTRHEELTELVLPSGTVLIETALVGTNRTERAFTLPRATPYRRVVTDVAETKHGSSFADLARTFAAKAKQMQPVLWVGIGMMTVVTGALLYFKWWTKAGLAFAIGLLMILAAQVIPAYGGAICIAGVILFLLVSFIVLYVHFFTKGDANRNLIPDFLEKKPVDGADTPVDC